MVPSLPAFEATAHDLPSITQQFAAFLDNHVETAAMDQELIFSKKLEE